MKFVKGDAIAGIIIAAVNVAGGFAVGVLQRGLAASDAADTYAVLSIGDGLASQIPSLLVSVSAGMMVTKPGAAPEAARPSALDGLVKPGVVFPASLVFALMSLAPGLPGAPFFTASIALASSGLLAARKSRKADAIASSGAAGPAAGARPAILSPLTIEAGSGCTGLPEHAVASFDSARRKLHAAFGVRIPAAPVRPISGGGDLVLKFHGSIIFRHEVAGEGGAPDPGLIESDLIRALEPRLPDLVGVQEAHELVEEIAAVNPVLVKETVPKLLGYPRLAELLRRLLEEGVSVSDLRGILEALAACGPVDNMNSLVENIRASLRRQICAGVSRGSGSMKVLIIDSSIESAICDGIAESSGRQWLAMSPETARSIVSSIAAAASAHSPQAVLADAGCRRFLRKIIESELPNLPVLSFQELTPEIRVEPVGKASLKSLSG
jgi:type III secretion protein V